MLSTHETEAGRGGLRRGLLAAAVVIAIGLLPAAGFAATVAPHHGDAGAHPAEIRQDDGDGVTDDEVDDPAPSNVVQVYNQNDNRFRLRGRIQLAHAHGQQGSPLNDAEAYSSCTGCSTFAVALQIVLVERDAQVSSPQNTAFAVNYQCTGCTTVADAYQYVVPVDDPDQVPDDIHRLLHQMDGELRSISHDRSITVPQAEAQVNAVIGQFQELASNLYATRQEDDAGGNPDATAAPTSSPDAAGTATPADGSQATPLPSPSPAATTVATPAATAAGTPAATPTSTATAPPTATPTPPTASPTPMPSDGQ